MPPWSPAASAAFARMKVPAAVASPSQHGRPVSHASPGRPSPRSRTSSRVARSKSSASTPSSSHWATHLSRPSSPMDQKCATWRPSGRAIDSSRSGAASSKLWARAIARATPYCAVRRAESRSSWPRRRAMNTAMHATDDEHRGGHEVAAAEEGVPMLRRNDGHRDRDGQDRHDHGLASRRSGRGYERPDEQELNEQRVAVDREVDDDDDRHGSQRQRKCSPGPGRVPRNRVRAQLGREYSGRTLAVPVPEGVVRVRAPNASALTLDGTNSYLVSRWVVDPGPLIPSHLEAVRRAADDGIEGVVLTHSHSDHAEAAGSSVCP